MAGEEDWGELARVKPARSGPRLLFCAAGCLVPVVLLTIVVGWGFATFRRGRDPVSQWQRLQTILPAEHPPEGWHLLFGFQPGWLSFLVSEELFFFVDDETLERRRERAEPTGAAPVGGAAMILVWTEKPIDKMFDLTADGIDPYLIPDPVPEGAPPREPRPLLGLAIQGRELPLALLRDFDTPRPWFGGGEREEDAPPAPTTCVDLTPPRPGRHLVLLAQSGDDGPVDLDTIRGFLAAFDLNGIR